MRPHSSHPGGTPSRDRVPRASGNSHIAPSAGSGRCPRSGRTAPADAQRTPPTSTSPARLTVSSCRRSPNPVGGRAAGAEGRLPGRAETPQRGPGLRPCTLCRAQPPPTFSILSALCCTHG